MTEQPGDHAPSRVDRIVVPTAAFARRFLAWGLVVAGLGAPLALGWSLGTTTVQATIGVSPATLSFTTRGHSEVRLGIAGTIYLPLSRGPVGVVTTVDGPGDPGAGTQDLASFVTPRMLALYSGLFHDPGPSVQSYVDELTDAFVDRALDTEVLLSASGGLLLALALPRTTPGAVARRAGRRGVAVGLVLAVGGCATGVLLASAPTAGSRSDPGDRGGYPLPVLDGTVASGSTTDSTVLRLLLGAAVPRVQALVQRQEDDVEEFQQRASDSLRAQAASVTAPRDGETAVLVQSDMHCNTSMIRLQREVVSLLHERFGDDVPAAMAVTGDLTTNGTAAEGGCIRSERRILAGHPVVAVTGNHETATSVDQARAAGMALLTGSVRTMAGVSALGDGDPSRSELFGATSLRGKETEAGTGRRLRRVAEGEDVPPDLLLVHEAYAAAAFLGVDDMTTFLTHRGSAIVPHSDGVEDVPARAVLYGHWHRAIQPRVVWNSDGSWTLVMELNTSGGAIDTPTLNHFSTPWSPPQQEASFPVLFLDRGTGLVTGYQLYRFDTDGAVTVEPRVGVGDPASPLLTRGSG